MSRPLAWGAKLEPHERRRVQQIADSHGCDPSWFTSAMAFETGETFSPSIVNEASGATGMIQFMPSTAKRMGTTTADIAKMTRMEQLDLVEEYFEPYKGRLKTLSDVYMAILWPAAIGKPEDRVIFASGSSAYLMNKGLDLNRDGGVTKAECAAKVEAKLARGLLPQFVTNDPAPIEDRSTVFTEPSVFTEHEQTHEVNSMAPLIPILLSTIASAIPDIAKIFAGKDPSEVAQRNTALVQKVAEVVIKGADAVSLGDAAEKIAGSPQIAAQVAQAVKGDPTLSLMLVEAGGGGIGGARAFAASNTGNPGMVTMLQHVTYAALAFLAFANVAGFALAGFLLYLNKPDWQQIVSALIQADIAAGFTALGFWLGSSLAKGGSPTANVRE